MNAAERRHLRVVAAVTWRGDTVLLTQRPPGGPIGLLWEFPGGKLEPGETAFEALVRELREELGVVASPRRTLALHEHSYAHGLDVELQFIECTLASDAFTPDASVHAWRWVRPVDIAAAEVLEADRDFLAALTAGAFDPHRRST